MKTAKTESKHHDVTEIEIMEVEEFDRLTIEQRNDILEQFCKTVMVAHELNSAAKRESESDDPTPLEELTGKRFLVDGNTVRYNVEFDPTSDKRGGKKAAAIAEAIEKQYELIATMTGKALTEEQKRVIAQSVRENFVG